MFLKVSDTKCLNTKDLRKVEIVSKTYDCIAFTFADKTENIEVKCPLYEDTSSDHAAFIQRVYASCYLAIIMEELSNRRNISGTFDHIILANACLPNNEEFIAQYEETKSDFDGNTTRENVIRILVADIVNDLMDGFKLHYLED